MSDSTLANLPAATAATGGFYYGIQGGADKKFTMSAAGATLAEAASAAAQRTALSAASTAANTFTGAQTITGGTVTDSTPLLAISQTWNDAADTFRAITVDITDTASAEFSSWFRATRGGTQFFSLGKKSSWGINNMPTLEGDGNAAGQVCFNSSHGSVILARKDGGWNWVASNTNAFGPSGCKLGWSSASFVQSVTSEAETFFMRKTTNVIQQGASGSAPSTQTFMGPSGVGTNIAGGKMCIAPGQSTGSAAPAVLALQGTAAGSSGTTAQTLVDVLSIIREGVIRISNIPTTSVGLSTGDVYSNAGVLMIV